VTKPTTIRAITEIPAKIPRPIGSTEIFFPGIWKAAAWVAEEVDDEALSAPDAGDVPLVDVAGGVGVEVGALGCVEVVEVCDEGGETLESIIDEKPLTDNPGFADDAAPELPATAADRVDEEIVTAGGAELAGGGGAFEPEPPPFTVHCRTTWTKCSPFGPVTGVNVTLHVSVTGPPRV